MRLRVNKRPTLGGGTAELTVDFEFGFDVAGGAAEAINPQGSVDIFVLEIQALFVMDIGVDDHETDIDIFEIVDGKVGVEELEA